MKDQWQVTCDRVTGPKARDRVHAPELDLWLEFFRLISCGGDPKVTSTRVRALPELLDAGRGGG